MKGKLRFSFFTGSHDNVVGIVSIEGAPNKVLRTYAAPTIADIMSEASDIANLDWKAKQTRDNAIRVIVSQNIDLEDYPIATADWTALKALSPYFTNATIEGEKGQLIVRMGLVSVPFSVLERAFHAGLRFCGVSVRLPEE